MISRFDIGRIGTDAHGTRFLVVEDEHADFTLAIIAASPQLLSRREDMRPGRFLHHSWLTEPIAWETPK